MNDHNNAANSNVFVPHAFPETEVDLGEVVINFAEAGSPDNPALILLPEQTGSWWSYEPVMSQLAEHYHVFALDMRGQGRSSWTPDRYSLDNFGNDIVRFISIVVQRPAIVAGNSAGGILAAWLSAFAMPGQIRGAFCEDAPFFSMERSPAVGHHILQATGPMFELLSKYLGDQWSVGDWPGLAAAAKAAPEKVLSLMPWPDEAPQNIKEYDPEWSRAFLSGTVAVNCPHVRMLTQVKTPVFVTHHYREIDSQTGDLAGAMSDLQAQRAVALMRSAGVAVEYVSMPEAVHMLHTFDPDRYAQMLHKWAASLADS